MSYQSIVKAVYPTAYCQKSPTKKKMVWKIFPRRTKYKNVYEFPLATSYKDEFDAWKQVADRINQKAIEVLQS